VLFKELVEPVNYYKGITINQFEYDRYNTTEKSSLIATYSFNLPRNLAGYSEKYPMNIIAGLVKLGGLIAILKVGFFL
jgi:hypothetical protein